MKQFAFMLATCFFTVIAHAEDRLHYNLISLSVSQSVQVENDTLTTVIRVQQNGYDTGKLTDKVNADANQIIEAAKHYAEVSIQSSGYYTQPLYKDGKINSWQVIQSLTVTSNHFKQVSELLADINGLGIVQSMQFSVSNKRQEEIKHSLLKQAIDKFKTKAALITKQFGMSSYKLVNLSVDNGNISPMPMMQRSMMMVEAKKSVAPTLESGTNEVSVHLNGSIQLSSQ